MFSTVECLQRALFVLEGSWVQWWVQHPWSELCVASVTLLPMTTRASPAMKWEEKKRHWRTIRIPYQHPFFPFQWVLTLWLPNGRCSDLCQHDPCSWIAQHLIHTMHLCWIKCGNSQISQFGKRQVYVESVLTYCIGACNFNSVRLKTCWRTKAMWRGRMNMGMGVNKLGPKSGSYHYHTM